jgi:CDGSH iron-sulfur domain-containing protein 3
MSVPAIAQKGPYPVQVEAGKIYYWCSCGLSKSQPFCNGSHAGTGLSPIKIEAAETKTVYLCGCKSSKAGVFCDGTHTKL